MDWALGGNATYYHGYCNGNEGGNVTASSASDPGTRRPNADSRVQKRGVQRQDPHNPYEEKMEWNGDELPHDKKQPPVTILPDGARHEFDPEQNYVSWSAQHLHALL